MKHPGLLVLSLIALYPCAWVGASYGLLGEAHIGYDRDFYIVKHAIQKTGCIESLAYSRHEDLTLEDFHFRLRTKSGRVVRLWFHERQDVNRVCNSPTGLLVVHPKYPEGGDQAYGIERIVHNFRDKSVKVLNLRTLLVNIDDLAAIFDANYGGAAVPRLTSGQASLPEYLGYLRIELVDESVNNSWVEYPIE